MFLWLLLAFLRSVTIWGAPPHSSQLDFPHCSIRVWGLQAVFASACLPVTRPCAWSSSCLRASAAAIRSTQPLSACQHRSWSRPPHSLRGGAKETCNSQREGEREGSKWGERCTTSSFHLRDAALPCTSHLTAFYPIWYQQCGETSLPHDLKWILLDDTLTIFFFFFPVSLLNGHTVHILNAVILLKELAILVQTMMEWLATVLQRHWLG